MAIALRAMAALRQSAHRSPVGAPLSSNFNLEMKNIGQPVARGPMWVLRNYVELAPQVAELGGDVSAHAVGAHSVGGDALVHRTRLHALPEA